MPSFPEVLGYLNDSANACTATCRKKTGVSDELEKKKGGKMSRNEQGEEKG
jgi:hypothetical protein